MYDCYFVFFSSWNSIQHLQIPSRCVLIHATHALHALLVKSLVSTISVSKCNTPSVRKYLSSKWIKRDVPRTIIKNRVGDDGVPAILQYKSSNLYLTDRKETMAVLQKDTHTHSTFANKAFPRSSFSPTR